jgi:hypothetical protein
MMLTRWLKRISPVTLFGNPTENRHLEYRWKGNIAMCSNNRGRKIWNRTQRWAWVVALLYMCVCVCFGLTTPSVTEIAPNGWTVANNELESLSKEWSWSNLRFSDGTCLEICRKLRIFIFLRRFKPNTSRTPAFLLETACRLTTSVKLHSYYDTSYTTLRNGSSNCCLFLGCALDWRISYRVVWRRWVLLLITTLPLLTPVYACS